ncbi:MAG: HprK-related kinase B [Myxococcales bacterium]|nr:HprK-related kinase B [Myxococcales bacterium]
MLDPVTPFKSLVSGILAENPCEQHLDLRFTDCRIRVRSNSALLLTALARYFGRFVEYNFTHDFEVLAVDAPSPRFDLPFQPRTPDPGKSKIKEEFRDLPDGRVIRKRLTGMVFFVSPCANLGVGRCVRNESQVVNFIISRYLQWLLHQGGVLAHAAAVVHRRRGLALAGFSGMGKSSLALHLISQGMHFASNDRLVVRQTPAGPVLHGVPKLPRINPGTAVGNPALHGVLSPEHLAAFRALSEAELWSLEHKHDVLIDDVFGPDRIRLTAPMAALVILNWRRGAGALRAERVDLGERRDLLRAFMKSTGLFYQPPSSNVGENASEEEYLRELEGCAVYELGGGVDFDAATSFCQGLLE